MRDNYFCGIPYGNVDIKWQLFIATNGSMPYENIVDPILVEDETDKVSYFPAYSSIFDILQNYEEKSFCLAVDKKLWDIHKKRSKIISRNTLILKISPKYLPPIKKSLVISKNRIGLVVISYVRLIDNFSINDYILKLTSR